MIIRVIALLLFLLPFLQGCETEDYVPTTGSVSGVVKSAESGLPLENCYVTASDEGTTHTDANGHFSFTGVRSGDVTLTYQCTGYQQASQTVRVYSGKGTSADISLNAIPYNQQIEICESVLDFGAYSAVQQLTIKNKGTEPASYSVKSEADWIEIDSPKGVISPKGQANMAVTVDRSAVSEGHYEKILTIDCLESVYEVIVLVDKGEKSRPAVQTLAVNQSRADSKSIEAKASLTKSGSSAVTQHGFCYAIGENPNLENNSQVIKLGNLNGPKDFGATISGLEYGQEYLVRAYATNGEGTAYGEVLRIVLTEPSIPGSDDDDTEKNPSDYGANITVSAKNITPNSAHLAGAVTAQKGSWEFTEVGFFYGTNSNPTIRKIAALYKTPISICDFTFEVDIDNLNENTTYYYRGYILAADGSLIEGEVKTFDTPLIPTITINSLKIEAESNVSQKFYFEGDATLAPQGNTVMEAGFLFESYGYDFYYNHADYQLPCEIINGKISYAGEIKHMYVSGFHIKAYMVLSNGTVIYDDAEGKWVTRNTPWTRK